MAIQFFTDKIKVGDFTLFEGNGGLQFDGVARAENYKGKGFQGDSTGYLKQTGNTANLQKYPFSSSVVGTDAGDLALSTDNPLGSSSSSTHGYICGRSPLGPPATATNTIQKFPFAVDNTGNDVGDLTYGSYGSFNGGASAIDFSKGYVTGGNYYVNTINSYPFAVDGNATDVGDMSYGAMYTIGNSSLTHGYVAGGGSSPAAPARNINTINKYPFATNTNATDIGDLLVGSESSAPQNSYTHAYQSGLAPTDGNFIQKFPFAANSNATNVGDLSQARGSCAGSSSRDHGYVAGGGAPVNTIDRFPFSTDTNGTDVGDLFQAASSIGGHQV
jgi:hypothetical protein